MKTIEEFKIGTRVIHFGAGCIQQLGTVIAIREPDQWGGHTLKIEFDDGRISDGVHMNGFSKAGIRWEIAEQFFTRTAQVSFENFPGDMQCVEEMEHMLIQNDPDWLTHFDKVLI